ncbi:hypothetical protein [Chryseobacterium indoltheticum]|jgi:hypothetical protein|uniref:hypothetical protein n=1 Tax=Chryseobacterium indoltheticum TaxID=254 RepID=UPI00242FB8B5|nr:hypothetical protein [Chryseobacterium indoltheticum]
MEENQNLRVMVNKFCTIFVLFILTINCQQKESHETIVNKEASQKEFSPEISINKILKLEDYLSFERFYPQYNTLKVEYRMRETPAILFSNNSEKEYLITYQYEGDTKNNFSLFEIGYLKDDTKLKNYVVNKTKYDNFKTESGLKLGMTLEEITNLKGSDFKVEKKSNEEIIRYTIDNPDDPKIKQYEMPPYFMEFYLKDKKVYKIIFGFEYP